MQKEKTRLLVVEDDAALSQGLQRALTEEDRQVMCCDTIKKAKQYLQKEEVDLLLLDVNLPDGSGFDLLQEIRETSLLPVILLTANDLEMDIVNGLEQGANDYITKPFSMPILVRKIGAVLRRSSMIPEQEHQTITYKNLVLDMDSYTAAVDGVSFDLTQREFEVLRELLLNQGRVLTRQNLLDKLWKYDFYGDERVVDTHIKNLRKKLGIDFIQTIRGVGYKIDKEN